jgi:uncharacterized membrane protein
MVTRRSAGHHVRVRRRAPTAEGSRSRLWVWPAAATAVAFLSAVLLLRVRPDPSSAVVRLTWPGSRQAALAMLEVVAASVMTVTSLTFSLVIVTFQLASQQFSPRLLRELAHDPVTKAVLAVLVATFIFAVTVLRGPTKQGRCRPRPSWSPSSSASSR